MLIQDTEGASVVVILTVPETVAALAGAVIVTASDATPTCTMLATEGTPEPLSMNIIYSPGGLKFGSEGAVTVS